MRLKIIRYTVFTELDGLKVPETVAESTEHVNSPNLIKFKVDMDKFHDHKDGNFKGTLDVTYVDDEDASNGRSCYDLQSSIQIKVAIILEFHAPYLHL